MTSSDYGKFKICRSVKLGTLLVRAGVVTPEAFASALDAARKSDQPTGSILVKKAQLERQDLASALHLQALLVEGLLTIELAIKALSLAHRESISSQEALSCLGWVAAVEPEVDELEELAVGSGFISRKLYEKACEGKEILGLCLILKGVFSYAQWDAILNALSLVKTGKIGRQEAVEALIRVRIKGMSLEQSLKVTGCTLKNPGAKLGELLVAACILSEGDLLQAVEQSIRKSTKLGEQLVQSSKLTPEFLELCLQVQGMVSTGILRRDQGVSVLKDCLAQQLSLQEVSVQTRLFAEDPWASSAIVNALSQSGIIKDYYAEEAMGRTCQFGMGPLAALVACGFISKDIYRAAVHCRSLLESGQIRVEHAILALQWCERTGCGAEEALSNIGLGGADPAEMEPVYESPVRPVPDKDDIAVLQDMIKMEQAASRKGLVLGCCAFVVVVATIAGLTMPEQFKLYAWWSLLLGLGVAFLTLGTTWNRQQEQEEESKALRIQIARRSLAARRSVDKAILPCL